MKRVSCVKLTPCEAQALLDALDTLEGNGLTAVTADLDVLVSADNKLHDFVKEHPCS